VLISETGVSSKYAGTRLSEGTAEGLYTIEFPMEGENGGMGDATVTAALPLLTSWKTADSGRNAEADCGDYLGMQWSETAVRAFEGLCARSQYVELDFVAGCELQL